MESPGTRWRGLRAVDPTAAAECLLLLAIMLSLGVALVPCRATSFWPQGEFTGWVVPIGNRIAEGQVLYADGGHSPLPPLSFALSALLLGSGGRWIHESLLNHVLQCLTLLALYTGLSLRLPRPIPFLVLLGALPIFFALPKSILYDPAVQLFVAVLAVLAAVQLSSSPAVDAPPGANRARASRSRLGAAGLAGLAIATAAALLSKQNTALGAMAGCVCALALFPRTAPLGNRLARSALYLGASGLALLGGCLLLSPYARVPGFFVDVFITGSEPKGGVALALKNLESYLRELLGLLTPVRVAAVAALVVGALLGGRRRAAKAPPSADRREHPTRWMLAVDLAALVTAGAGFAASSAYADNPIFSPGFGPLIHFFTPVARLGWLPKHLMAVGLLLTLVLPVLCLWRSARVGRRELHALAVLALLTFPAAIMHSLSVPSFRWTYDNNPLIVVALGALCLFGFRTLQLLLPGRPLAFTIAMTAAAAMLQFTLWSTSTHTIRRLERCTEAWPEVRYLSGAKLPIEAAPLRELVPLVRRLAPAPHDEVLVLPNDPDLEAWFDRKRPLLSSAVVFVDQYWDRYVDPDFERLASHPPKVIVIAPRNWGPFMQTFWGAGERGARRLTMRVILELLPQRYELHASIAVPFLKPVADDYMDVWVRKPTSPGPGASASR
jgi:hypothetical protein